MENNDFIIDIRNLQNSLNNEIYKKELQKIKIITNSSIYLIHGVLSEVQLPERKINKVSINGVCGLNHIQQSFSDLGLRFMVDHIEMLQETLNPKDTNNEDKTIENKICVSIKSDDENCGKILIDNNKLSKSLTNEENVEETKKEIKILNRLML